MTPELFMKTSERIAEGESLPLPADIFTAPTTAAAKTVLSTYLSQILFDLHHFIQEHVGTAHPSVPLQQLVERFKDSQIKEHPEQTVVDAINTLIKEIAPYAINVSAPHFVGHMTGAIPFFMVHLHTIVAALNQNVVKLETSGIVTLRERQVLAKLHRAIYGQPESFYQEHIQNPDSTLGSFVEDGTLANLTALWVARNALFKPKRGFTGVEKEGLVAAYKAYKTERSVVLVSQLGHYSLSKVAGILGIGHRNLLPIEVNCDNCIDIDKLQTTINTLQKQHTTKILAVVGIAGATETGSIDPLATLAEICAEHKIHFHVDAAWGGPTLLSKKYSSLLAGIEQADSVTIDGHKQFYLPMSCGMVYFKDPHIMNTVTYHANYITRPGSADLGIRSLVGSRAATSLILGSALDILGTAGYAQLLEHSIETTQAFAQEIQNRPLFELVTSPQLNILTYSLCPETIKIALASADFKHQKRLLQQLDHINCFVQQEQKTVGRGFVSRTTLKRSVALGGNRKVLRAVIMNPLTNLKVLREVLDEQEEIYQQHFSGTKLNLNLNLPN